MTDSPRRSLAMRRPTATGTKEGPAGCLHSLPGPPQGYVHSPAGYSNPAKRRPYFNQASTLSRLASTHFFAAASGVILSSAMYLATVFWSSLVQVKFLTRS